MGKLTGTQHGDAANALFAFYADKAQELEEAGQYFMARHRLGLSGSRRAYCDEVLGLLEKGVGVHRRLIGESLTIELALDRLTKEHLDRIPASERTRERLNQFGPDGGRSAGESGGRRQGQRGEEYRQGTGGRSGLGRGVSDSALLVAFVLAVLGAVLLIAAASW